MVSHHVSPPSWTTILAHHFVQGRFGEPTMSAHHIENGSHHSVQIPLFYYRATWQSLCIEVRPLDFTIK